MSKILVIDDEEVIRLLLAELLTELDHEVTTAGTADEGFAMFEANPDVWDMVITDVMMPGNLNGCELAWALSDARPNLSVLVCSGHLFGQPAHLPTSAEFLRKPWHVADIEAAVGRLAGRPCAAGA